MADIYFNTRGKSHHMRIRTVDDKLNETLVYEALVDGTDYTFFEGSPDLEVWELIELAVQAYLDYRVDETVEQVQWEGRS